MDTATQEFEKWQMAPAAKPWYQRLAESGQKPEDSVELKRQKSLLVVVTLLKASICAGWYIPLALLGAVYAAAAPLFYQLATTLSVWMFARSKNLETFRSRQVLLILLLPMGVHFGLGGFGPSGGVIIWSFLAPLISLLFEGPRQSIRWFLAFVGAVIVAGVLESTGWIPVYNLPWWMQQLFYVMNFVCVTGIVYAGVRYFAHLLEKEKEIQIELNQQLQQANEHKSKFLAGMSHELRTPLNAIIGFTRIVKRRGMKVLPEKQTKNLDKILLSAEHLLGLINDILDLAKIEAGHIEVEKETFLLPDLIQGCVNTSEPLMKEGVKLTAEIEPNLPPLHSDAGKIKQIVLNLISNAAKFTHEGNVKVIVQTQEEGLDIVVQDTGIGISDEAMDRIFEEFQQADSSTTRKYGGTGLGLSISFKLAELLEGSLSVESAQGQGSTFTLHLPVPEQFLKSLKQDTAPPSPRRDNKGTGPKVRQILAIDDDPDVIYMLQDCLQDEGYQVIGANSNEEGLQKARTLQPFAITLDIIMPERDGWQTLHDLKQDPRTQHIPVLMLSIVNNKQLGVQLGAADCLLKPLDGKQLRDALKKLEPAAKASSSLKDNLSSAIAAPSNLGMLGQG